ARRSHEDSDAPILIHRVHRRDAPAHRGRANVSRRQPRHRGGIELITILGVGGVGWKHERDNPKEQAELRQKGKMTASRIHRFVSSLWFRISPTAVYDSVLP